MSRTGTGDPSRGDHATAAGSGRPRVFTGRVATDGSSSSGPSRLPGTDPGIAGTDAATAPSAALAPRERELVPASAPGALTAAPPARTAPWPDAADWTLHQRAIVRRHSLGRALRRLQGYLRACQMRGEAPRPDELASLWNRIADECHDVYAVAAQGADPQRIARAVH